MKRRILGIILAIALCIGLAIPAMADENDDVNGDVNGEFNGEANGEENGDANGEEDEEANGEEDEDDEYTEVGEPEGVPAATDPLDGAAEWAVDELELALEAGLLIEDMFGAWGEDTSRLLAAEALVALVEALAGAPIESVADAYGFDMSATFTDTDSSAAVFLKAAGITTGIDQAGLNFGPDGSLTRAMFVTFIGRIAENLYGLDLSGYALGTETFNDVSGPGYAYADQYIGWAVELGITRGTGDGVFSPGRFLTNQETGAFMYRSCVALIDASEGAGDDEADNGDEENGDYENGDEENGDEENGDEENGDEENGDEENGDEENGDEENGDEE